jgi:hypothetical protein
LFFTKILQWTVFTRSNPTPDMNICV